MRKPFVFQVVGYKNTGKTTLVCGLLRNLKARGLRVGTVKRDGHDFETDRPGTDSWKHREAGAEAAAIVSPYRTAIMRNSPSTLDGLLAEMADMDVVLVEGFKQEPYPKIVLIKTPEDLRLLNELGGIAAAAVWFPCYMGGLPLFAVDDADGIAGLLLELACQAEDGAR